MGRRIAAVASLAALFVIVAVWLVIVGSGDETAGGASRSAVPTSEVERRTLADEVTVDGTIGYAGASTVVNRLAGTITSLPSVGDLIRRGERLLAVNDEPVILMYGSLPAYRRLAVGVSGQDARQLERNLSALGYDPGTVDDEYTSTTAAAVSSWQDDLGLPQTGAVQLGRVVFLPDARRVTEVSATLGSDGSGASSGGASGVSAQGESSDGTTLVADRTAIEVTTQQTGQGTSAGKTPNQGGGQNPNPGSDGQGKQPSQGQSGEDQGSTGNTDGTSPTPEATTTTPSQESGSATETESAAASAAASVSTPVLEASSTERIVSASVDADEQSLVARGRRVTVTLPDGDQARGRVARVKAVSASSEADTVGAAETEPTVEATIKLIRKGRIPALDGAAVSVTLTDEVRRGVLTVPLTALVSVGGDRFAVIAVEAGQRRRIVVRPGLAADGYVEVEGDGLREGMAVEAPE